jgi:pimeloyl-ACP methyl ester carboxylesterase
MKERMEPLFEHRQEFAGYDTRVLELEGSGPPLLLLHGYADSADTWRPLLAALGRAERRAVAVDLPGFGTAAPLQRDAPILPQLDAFARDAAAYAGDAPVVAGNSLGGCVALRMGEDEALDLAGIAPIAPAGLDMARWFTVVERDPLLRTLLSLPTPLPEAVVRGVVGRVYAVLAFADPAKAPPGSIAMFTAHHRDRAVVSRYLATARRLLPELENPFRLERIRCPVLLIWGTRDRMVSHSGAERIAAALPTARIELLDGCGHCPQLEATERVTKLLGGFPPSQYARAA